MENYEEAKDAIDEYIRYYNNDKDTDQIEKGSDAISKSLY